MSAPKILIIEDSIVSAMMMEATINRKQPDFVVRNRRTLKGGREELDAFEANLIILDLSLPDSPEGTEALAAIAEFRRQGRCVIAASGFHDLKEKALAAGANDFISKVIGEDPQPFMELITALLPECSQRSS
jgi:two-component system NtrC family response regulator